MLSLGYLSDFADNKSPKSPVGDLKLALTNQIVLIINILIGVNNLSQQIKANTLGLIVNIGFKPLELHILLAINVSFIRTQTQDCKGSSTL